MKNSTGGGGAGDRVEKERAGSKRTSNLTIF
jgi:hypothetical protein